MSKTCRFVALLVVSWLPAVACSGLRFVSIDPGSTRQLSPDVAARAAPGSESYMAAFEKRPPGGRRDVYVRPLNGTGVVVGPSVNVSSVPLGFRATRPAIAFRSTVLGETTYMVAWQLEDESETVPSIIQAVVLDVGPGGDIRIASGGPFQVSFCGADPALDPDVAATTATPSCSTLGDCIPYIVAYRCTPRNHSGQRSSVAKVAAVNAVTFLSTDTAIAFSQGAEDSTAMAPHVAYGDLAVSDRYVLTFRMLDGMGGAVVKAAQFDHFAESGTFFYTEDGASAAPVVAFSKGATVADGGGWTIVRKMLVGGSDALVGQHFTTDLPVKLGSPYVHVVAPTEDIIPSYTVAGSPNSSDFLLVYSQGNTLVGSFDVTALQVRGDSTATAGLRYSAREPGNDLNQTDPCAAFEADPAVGNFLFAWHQWGFDNGVEIRGIRGLQGDLYP